MIKKDTNPFFENRLNVNRRYFLGKLGVGLGGLAFSSLWTGCNQSSGLVHQPISSGNPLAPRAPQFPARVKNVI